MQLTFLGSGSAFVSISENFQSNMLLQSDSGKKLLIDCGTDVRHSAAAIGVTSQDIDAVYISHFHADHIGGLEWLAFTTYFHSQPRRPKLLIHPSMLARLWNKCLSGGLESIEGPDEISIHDYFEVMPCTNDSFLWESIELNLVKTVHVYNAKELLPSYGLDIVTANQRIFITTDTRFSPEIHLPFYEKADLIFHDCETSPHKSCVHTHFDELAALDPRIKAKMWLYHFSTQTKYDAIAAGFRGYVQKGQVFDHL